MASANPGKGKWSKKHSTRETYDVSPDDNGFSYGCLCLYGNEWPRTGRSRTLWIWASSSPRLLRSAFWRGRSATASRLGSASRSNSARHRRPARIFLPISSVRLYGVSLSVRVRSASCRLVSRSVANCGRLRDRNDDPAFLRVQARGRVRGGLRVCEMAEQPVTPRGAALEDSADFGVERQITTARTMLAELETRRKPNFSLCCSTPTRDDFSSLMSYIVCDCVGVGSERTSSNLASKICS